MVLEGCVLAAGVLRDQRQVLDSLVRAELFFPIALLIIGVLLLLFGFKAYKPIVVFNCIVLGFWVGGQLGERAQVTTVAAVIGAVMLGAISWPLMKYAVALCGGMIGAIVGMVIWAYFDYPPHLTWAGGLAGLIFLGMLSFILFKMSVILFSCIQGAIMLVLGASALLISYGPSSWAGNVQGSLENKPILMPLLVSAIAILGIIYQQQKHGLLGNEGGGGGGSGGGETKPAKK